MESDNCATPRVSVIMPAYKEEQVIASVIERVRKVMDNIGRSYEILVVDDGSPDNTARAAHDAGARVVAHPYNIGNGAAVKTGIRNARGENLVLLDADGQHPPEVIPALLEKLEHFDMAVGARAKNSDTSLHRDFANRIYNELASYVTGRQIPDLTSGFRAIKGHIAREFVSLLPNTFSYPSTLTLALFRSGYSVAYLPITAAKRQGKSKIKLLTDGSRFFLIILKIATLFAPMRLFFPVSLAMFLAGLAYGLVKIFVLDAPYGPTSAMLITMSVLVFLVGLVSEQVAQLRFDSLGRRIEAGAPDDCKGREGVPKSLENKV
ncbi:MAG: glycosyltransferase family 2 protein [Desulfatibacillaceae bacterium]|nr:glycosyltransferase family 2 protein [Desulfatibacillaceae bacterium]